jgi:hypothetical protein
MDRDIRDMILVFSIVGVICAVATVFLVRAMRRGRKSLEDQVHEWAKGRDLRVVEMGDSFWGGPFWNWTHIFWDNRGLVYRIVAEDGKGKRRSGYLRIRRSVLDAYSEPNEVQVRWDDGRL